MSSNRASSPKPCDFKDCVWYISYARIYLGFFCNARKQHFQSNSNSREKSVFSDISQNYSCIMIVQRISNAWPAYRNQLVRREKNKRGKIKEDKTLFLQEPEEKHN